MRKKHKLVKATHLGVRHEWDDHVWRVRCRPRVRRWRCATAGTLARALKSASRARNENVRLVQLDLEMGLVFRSPLLRHACAANEFVEGIFVGAERVLGGQRLDGSVEMRVSY